MNFHHNIAVAIQSKLLGSQYLQNVFLAQVPAQNGQYPYATVSLKRSEAKFGDTIRNDRWFMFKVDVFQERTATGQGPTNAEAIATLLADEIITAFDADTTLSGLVSMVRPIMFDGNYVKSETGDERILEFTIEGRALVPSS